MIRLATVDNLSAATFRLVRPSFKASLSYLPPSECYRRVVRGECDAALVPVAKLPEFGRRVVPLGNYGVACEGPVKSVLLFSSLHLDQIALEQRLIQVTGKSETSRQLLRHLFFMRYGVTPVLRDYAMKPAACLLIGDDALLEERREKWAYTEDLGGWWHESTGLPFVFARWVARCDLPLADMAQIVTWLASSVWFAASDLGMEALVEMGIEAGHPELFLRDYYQRITPELDEKALRGLDTFLSLRTEELQCVINA